MGLSSAACVEGDTEATGATGDALSQTTIDGASWMSALPADRSLTELSIPGTHESCAQREPFPSTARCQRLDLTKQLQAGVRFLDVRCRHFHDRFEIHHGQIYQGLAFDEVLEDVTEFLHAHPSETIVMSVKQEHTPEGNDRSFAATFDAYVARNPGVWSLGDHVPTLGAARGKIVLFRRFPAEGAKGIDATYWPNKQTFSAHGVVPMQVQDEYEVDDNAAKWKVISRQLDAARTGDHGTLFVNFTSGYRSRLFGVPDIRAVSSDVNERLDGYLTSARGRLGIIAADFADEDSVQAIYRTNFE